MIHRADTPLLHSLRHAIDALATAHSHRDLYTRHHEDRVAEFAVSMERGWAVAGSPGGTGNRRQSPRYWQVRHSIEIISKPGKLSDPEIALVQVHCAIGHDILLQLRSAFPSRILFCSIIERLRRERLPAGLEECRNYGRSRILAVADVFDAMSSYRPYRAALSEDFVLGEIHKMAGTQLDQKAVDACTRYVISGKATHSAAASLVASHSGNEF